ncbi:type II secretion system F family protein [Novosphingobium sp. FKTRR1]|uniref:type II secretion system F family protein n=1 Tax=Novosphingobium sp. FKTRR1 TaxID=2879118 RepID=UPI001CEFC0B4|nr:type II secretion system F family protein [Novosphingobium sp. FKTRR1]
MSELATFRYRAVRADGTLVNGDVVAASDADAVLRIRREGARPVALTRVDRPGTGRARGPSRAQSEAARVLVAELAVLLKAGLPLDRALALAIDNIEDTRTATTMADLLKAVREGAPLSRAMADNPALFSPAHAAMAEAGEANGRLGEALERLSTMLEQAADLRRIIVTSMIYPVALLVIAVGVIAMMLLFVVPQFEHLLDTFHGQLPAASMAVIGASRFLRAWGLWLLLGLGLGGIVLAQALARPGARLVLDRVILGVPQLGELARRIDTARFAHTLGALLEGGVPLPHALSLARRTIANSVIGDAVGRVADGVREGGGLAQPLAATGVLPRMAVSFLRTGEETSQLALMLSRLAMVLDRDVRTRLERLVALLTPAITVILGAAVAGIIASILSAILGFNDLAVAQP